MTAVQSTFPATLDAAKASLQQIKHSDNDLYTHLTNVLSNIISQHNTATPVDTTNLLDNFESLSRSAKSTASPTTAATPSLYNAVSQSAAGEQLAQKTLSTYKTALSTYQQPTVDEDNEPVDIDYTELINTNLPDIRQQAILLSRAGVSIGVIEWYKLQLAINKLIDTEKAKEVEFKEVTYWGQITTTSATTAHPYTIVQVVPESYPELPEPAEGASADALSEEYGVGVNTYMYYVTTSLDTPAWTALPYLTAVALQTARSVRRLLTGNLKAYVPGFPRFPFNEAMYLRAVIARITHSTHICPKTAYVFEADNDEPTVVLNEEFNGLPAADLLQPANWTHCRAAIRAEGRTSIFVPEDAEEDEVIKSAAEPQLPQLRNISEDGTSSWALRITPCGDVPSVKPVADPTVHTVVTDDAVEPKYVPTRSVAMARSTVWPGAMTVAYNKQYMSVYYGNGLKQLSTPYKPLSPHVQQVEVSNAALVEQTDILVEPAKLIKTKKIDEDGEEDEEPEVVESEEEEEVADAVNEDDEI